jgi:tetratricopeptide (TPR) repeat protein
MKGEGIMVEAKISPGQGRPSSDNSGTSHVSAHPEVSQRKKLQEPSIDKVLRSFIEALRDSLRKQDTPRKTFFVTLANLLDTTPKIITGVWTIVLTILLFIVFVLFIPPIYAEFSRDTVVLEAFEVPDALREQGFTDRAIANKLKDQLDLIYETAATARASRQFSALGAVASINVESPISAKDPKDPINVGFPGAYSIGAIGVVAPIDIESADSEERFAGFDDVQIPGAGLSLGSILRFGQKYYRTPPRHITGEVTLQRDKEQLYLTVRAAGIIPSKEISGTLTELDATLLGAAEHIYKYLHPFTLAAYLQSENRPDDSLEIIEYILQHDPDEDDPWVYYLRGIAYLNKEDYALAIADFDRASKLGLVNASVYNIRGLAYAAQGDLEAAIADYSQAITRDPALATAYFNRGLAYAAQGDLEAAIADYSQAITRDPQDALAYNNRGLAYYAQGDLEAAIDDYNQAITLDPALATAYFNRGLAYAAQGDLEAAIDDYSQAITLDPKFAAAYIGRSYAYKAQGDLDAARADYSQAITFDPQNALAYNNRGLAYADQGDLAAAIANYSQAIARDPELTTAYFNRGLAYADQGDLEDAIADYSQVLTLDPQDTAAYNNRGNAYADLQDYQAAIADYNQALALDPQDALAYFNRGLAYADLQNYQAAIADSKQATALDPMFAVAYNNICWWESLAGNAAEVRGTCERAVALAPEDGAIRDSRGLARASTGDYAGAIADFTSAVAWMKEAGWPESFIDKREDWITELKAGRNPFDSATLAELRNE